MKKFINVALVILLLEGCFAICLTQPSKKVDAEDAYQSTELPQEYQDYCDDIGQKYGICPELLMAIIEQESGGDPNTVGSLGEVGLMQIYPKFHRDRMDKLNVYSLYDPYSNILVGADYLSELFREYQDLSTVLMIYNGSPDALERAETYNLTEYADTIINRSAELERLHKK